jgi:DNA modification methylase
VELDQIVCGDCLEVMAEMPDGCVDAVVTDPPYDVNLNKSVCGWDNWPVQETWKQIARVLKPTGVLAFSIAPHVAHERVPDVTSSGFKVLEVGFWVYGNGRPVHQARLKRCYDLIYFMSLLGKKLYPQNGRGFFLANSITGRKGKISADRTLGRQFHKCQRQYEYKCGQKYYFPANVACLPGSSAFGDSGYDLIFAVKRLLRIGKAEKKHPTEKPLDLVAQIVKLTSCEGDLVFDPFMGSGTTAEAAFNMGRHFYGCDVSPEYVALANARLKTAENADLRQRRG